MSTKEKVAKAPPKQSSKPEKETPKPLQDVVYIPPKPFMRNRLLLRMATVVAIVVALVLAMAVFFRVEHIQVAGMEQYTAWDISQASGIQQGDSLFSLGMPGAAARVQKLPYVKDVRIGIKLPNTVVIHVTEVRVTYAVKAENDDWWLVDSDGKVIEKIPAEPQVAVTKILGVRVLAPKAGQSAEALETAMPEVDAEGNTIPVTVTAAHQLKVALGIAKDLEANGIIGQAASIDVNDLGDIQVWYGQQYQIKLGNENQLSYKISLAKGAIDTLNQESHNSGVLDVTLTVQKDGVKYTRFQ